MGGRKPCCSKEGLNKGAWSVIEDQILIDYIKIHGEGKWGNIPKNSGLKRCGKSCRLRWLNYLSPDIKRGDFSPEEDDLIIRLHRLLGNRWSLIAGRIPGRTDNEIKNYWNSTLGKKVRGEKLKQSKDKANIKSSAETPKTSIGIRTMASRCSKFVVTQEQQEPYKSQNFAKLESPETGATPQCTTSGETQYSVNLSAAVELDIAKLLASDISDSEFWNYSQLNNYSTAEEAESSGVARNTCIPSDEHFQFSPFFEEMLKDWIRDYSNLG